MIHLASSAPSAIYEMTSFLAAISSCTFLSWRFALSFLLRRATCIEALQKWQENKKKFLGWTIHANLMKKHEYAKRVQVILSEI
jgi:hypothetical protein